MLSPPRQKAVKTDFGWTRGAYFDERGKLFKRGAWFMQWPGDRDAGEMTTISLEQFHNPVVTFLTKKILKPLQRDCSPDTTIPHGSPLGKVPAVLRASVCWAWIPRM